MYMPSIFGESLFDEFFDDFARPAKKVTTVNAVPAVMKTDIKESDTGYELDVDLPGYKKEDVQAQLKDGYLTITATAKKDDEKKDENGKYIRRERYYGTCSRSFYVGDDLKQEDIKAKFEDGILKLNVPKKNAKAETEEHKFITIEG